MELPILAKNTSTSTCIINIQHDLSNLTIASIGEDNRISQEIATHTIQII
jgi:hypothetical protein